MPGIKTDSIMLYSFPPRVLLVSLLLIISIIPVSVYSQTRITPVLQIEESFISNKTSSLDESGLITTISPGIRYEATGLRNSLLFNYNLIASYYSSLSQQDQINQSLSLRSDSSHVPNHWDSYITSTIKQTNVSSDGIQIVNPNIQSDNTRELRTLGAGTALKGRWTKAITYQTALNVDYADFEDGESTRGAGINLGLSSNNTQRKLNWSTLLSSRDSRTANTDQQIHTVHAELNYRFTRKYATFLTLDKSKTENELLDDTNTIFGIHWTPNRYSFLKLGAGKRGDDTTYFLDSMVRNNRTTYTFNYDETVTDSRTLLIDETSIQPGFSPTSQTLSTTPILLKNGRIGITANGKRTDLTLAYFMQIKNQANTNSEEEVTEGINISANRRLSNLSSVRILLSHQESKTIQENSLDDASLAYDRRLSKKINVSIELRKTEQTSNITVDEYEQNLLNLRMTATF